MPERHLYARLGFEWAWHDLAALLRDYPWITFHGDHFSVPGFSLDSRCRSESRSYEEESTGNYYATPDCIEDYKVRCAERFREELIPGMPGCLDDDHSSGYGTHVLDLAGLGVLDKSWVADGLTQEEMGVIYDIDGVVNSRGNRARLAGRWGEEWATVRIADMPFLQTLEPEDQSILSGLSAVAGTEGRFRAVLFHPFLQGGVTDEMASIIASVRSVVYERSPDGNRLTDAEIVPRLVALLDNASQ